MCLNWQYKWNIIRTAEGRGHENSGTSLILTCLNIRVLPGHLATLQMKLSVSMVTQYNMSGRCIKEPAWPPFLCKAGLWWLWYREKNIKKKPHWCWREAWRFKKWLENTCPTAALLHAWPAPWCLLLTTLFKGPCLVFNSGFNCFVKGYCYQDIFHW